jgi:hypothetical protein
MSNKLKITLTGILIVILFTGLGFYAGNRDRELDKTNKEISDLKKQNEDLKKESKSRETTEKNPQVSNTDTAINDTKIMAYANPNIPNFSFNYDKYLELSETKNNNFPQISLKKVGTMSELKFEINDGNGLGGAGVACYNPVNVVKVDSKWIRVNTIQNINTYHKLGDNAALRGTPEFEILKKEAKDNFDQNVDPNAEFCNGTNSELLETNTTIKPTNFPNKAIFRVYADLNPQDSANSKTILQSMDEVVKTLKY